MQRRRHEEPDESPRGLSIASIVGYLLVLMLSWTLTTFLNLSMISPARDDLARSEIRFNRLFEESQGLRRENERLANEIEGFPTNEIAIRSDSRQMYGFQDPDDLAIEFVIPGKNPPQSP